MYQTCVCSGGDDKERHGVSEPGAARFHIHAGQCFHREIGRHDTGVPIQVHIQVQGQNRYAVYIQDGQHTSTLPRRGSKVQDSSMVLVGTRWHYLAACPLHHEMDNKIERTGFLDII